MRFVEVVAPGQVRVSETETPRPGERDVLLRMRACGLCAHGVELRADFPPDCVPILHGRQVGSLAGLESDG